MRHKVAGRHLNRHTSHRLAMFRNMVTSLLDHGRIYTTIPKAKEIRRWAEWMITLGKRGDLHARRQALAVIRERPVVEKLFKELGPDYQNRSGGYTRIIKVGFRRGDAAPMCLIELVKDSVPKKASKAAPQRPQAPAPVAEQTVALPEEA
jgi:large subunit ribosomal protein L17